MKGKGNKEKWAGEIYTGGKNTCRHAHKGSGTYTYKYTHMHSVMLPAGVLKGNHSFIPLLLFWVCVLHSVYLIREPGRVWLSARGHARTHTHKQPNTSSSFSQHKWQEHSITLHGMYTHRHTQTHKTQPHTHYPHINNQVSNVNLSSQGLWVLSEAEATERESEREEVREREE